LAALALRLVLAQLPFTDLRFLYLELPMRADALLLGAVVAMLYRDPQFMAKLDLRYVRLVGIAALAAFLAMAIHLNSFYFGYAPINTWGLSLTALASAALLLLALTPGTWSNRILSTPMLRFYGRYSYGLYLIHFTVANYCINVLEPAITQQVHAVWLAQLIVFAIVFGGSTVTAVLSFHLIEQPFLKMKRRFDFAAAPVLAPRQLDE